MSDVKDENARTVEFGTIPTTEFDWLKPQNANIINGNSVTSKSEDEYPTAVIQYKIEALIIPPPTSAPEEITDDVLTKDRLAKMIGVVLIGMSIAVSMFICGMYKGLNWILG